MSSRAKSLCEAGSAPDAIIEIASGDGPAFCVALGYLCEQKIGGAGGIMMHHVK